MRKKSLFKQTVALVLAGVLAFGNLSTAEAAVPETGQAAAKEVSPGSGTTKPEDINFPNGNLVNGTKEDGSANMNTQGGGAINIYDGYYTNLYFKNEPFISGLQNWFNFLIETNAPAGTKGCTLRADAYGWSYGDGADPAREEEHSWGDDWDKFKEVCAGDVIVSAYKYDANNLKFYIQFSSGDTEIYTLTYADGIPKDLVFYVGTEGGKVTQNKITFTEALPNSVKKITLDKQTAEVENEYIYASADDKDAGTIAMSTCGSVDISAQVFSVEDEEILHFKNVKWQVSDESKADITENPDGTVAVSLTDKAKNNDKITVTATASAADGSKAQAQCVITAKVTERIETIKVDAISVPDQILEVKYYSNTGAVGESVTIQPVITPDDADIKEVTLTTDSDVITITGSTITAVKEGQAVVKATSKSTSKASCQFKVTVNEPELGELTSDFTVGGFTSAGSGFEKLTGDFCIAYHFTNKTTGTMNWDNFIFQLFDGSGKDTTLRADAFALGNLHEGVNWSGAPSNWDSFLEAMKDADVTVIARRNDNAIEVKYHIISNEDPETVYDIAVVCSYAAGISDTLFARITGENVKVSNISLVNANEKVNVPVTKDAAYTYKSEDVFKNVEIGSSVTFGLTLLEGYIIKKVSYGKTVLTAGANGNYTIPYVTDKDTQLTVEAEIIKYPITYIVDGVAENDEFTINDVADGKVVLKAAAGIDGWYASANDKTTKITDFTAVDYMTNEGITVYGYRPYKVTLTSATLTNGTIEPFDAEKSYYIGDKVSIVTVPKQGYTANISVSYKDANNSDVNVETTKESKDGKEVVSFTMPAANVTVTCAEFTGVDKSGLEAAITAAKAIYDANNADGKYTETSYSVFKEAYEKAVQAKNATTQSAIDEAKNNLLQAQKDLKTVSKVTLDKQTITLEIGNSEKLTPTVTTDEEDKTVTWSSSKDTVATVKDGVVTAVAEGDAVITAALKDGAKAECKVTVKKASTNETKPALKLKTTSVTLYTGKKSNSISIKADVTGPVKTVKWTSKNKNIAKIVGNKIVAVKKGTTTVTATANGISQTVKVTVKNPTITVKNGKKKVSSVKVKKGKKVTLTVSENPKNSGSTLTKLKSKDKKTASVTLKKGKLTIKGKKKGKLTIVLKSGKGTKKIKVTVK